MRQQTSRVARFGANATRASAGFTLIEMLAVIVILSILAWILLVNVSGAKDTMKLQLTRKKLTEIGAMLSEYENDKGDYPPSSFTPEQGTPPNQINVGSECLYLALCGENGVAFGKFENPENIDEDQSSRRQAGFESLALYEITDDWKNPIAYFHHRDYEREDVYATISAVTSEKVETRVRALKNPKTGRFYNPRSFQLISAGEDGEFGTEDDIARDSP